jgi:hypothetical protein
LLVLSGAREDPGDHDTVTATLDDAKGKMLVIEVSVLAIVLYGLYLRRTGGISRSEKTSERRPDGTLVEREIVEYAPVDSPLKALTSLFQP